MDDSDESGSEASETLVEQDPDELSISAEEVVIDLATDSSDASSDKDFPFPLIGDDCAPVIKPRPYQLEMVEESLKRNIIVAMDTGSGKTHIAVMRMLHELERIPPHQMIWFLATTVSLCSQQYEYIRSQISSVQVKFLSGADNVDRWTHQTHWDTVLKNVKIVVSTYQILLDALSHGFVGMETLALIIFDEAHNCVGKHAGSKLMQNFYHKMKFKGLEVPHILGLTASPIMRSNALSLPKIEETLDAICRTPTKHRAELRLQVKLPLLLQVRYNSLPSSIESPGLRAIQSLGQVYRSMKLCEDPYYLSLLKEDTEKSRRALQKVVLSHKTKSREQIKNFSNIAEKILEDLGGGAAHYYVSRIIAKVTKVASNTDNRLGFWDVSSAESQYIAQTLKHVEVDSKNIDNILPVADKVTKLVDILLAEPGSFSGIIFVKERATASVLAHLLRVHPQTRDKFKIGTVVGTSGHTNRSEKIGELLDTGSKQDTLALFKSGKINLVIATSVLEEGIDVPVCNLVLCFEKPANLKSFVQRRGRARHRESKLVLLVDSERNELNEWQQLEADMRAIYEDEMRTLQEFLVQEDSEEADGRIFQVESTKALLDLDSAVPHLYHFCSTLPLKEYADTRPDFICTEEDGHVRAKVILPLSVNEAVRVAESRKGWLSEKNAIRDAAFEAYVALYHAGLVNDNLLPLLRHDELVDDLMNSAVETGASLMTVTEQLNPWKDIARAWQTLDTLENVHQCTINLGDLCPTMYLPVQFPNIQPFKVYWDANTELMIVPSNVSTSTDLSCLAKAAGDTCAILQAAFGGRFSIEKKQTCMQFSVLHSSPLADLLGRQLITNQAQLSQNSGLIRHNTQNNIAYVFKELLPKKPSIGDVQNPYDGFEATSEDTPHLSVRRLPRRLDFLHKILHRDQSESSKPYSVVLPVPRCTVDDIPFQLAQFGLLIPSIIRRYEIYLIAQELSTTLLKNVSILDLSLVATAVCASSANEETNYQRLEFLGDSILKTCTSVQLMAEYPLWHEGILSAKKDLLIANSRLSRAAIEIGLDRFVITKAFTGYKWRPLYISTLAKMENSGKRELSSKVLADVVEALIGAAMVNGGTTKALTCLQTFLPELSWQPLQVRRDFLYLYAPGLALPSTLVPVEELIGYKFTKKSLLTEAFTHASYNSGSGSLERLEFLGDSILDYIIVTAMYPYNLSHVQMHLLRTALVNADFLSWVCMEWSISQEDTNLITLSDPSLPITQTTEAISLPLWRFMRHTSPPLGDVQSTTSIRHSALRSSISSAIEHGTHYPWALLSKLQAQKFYSDIIESLLGAVWIDSGSFDVCKEMVERMGILGYMRRILKEGVHVRHPKEELGIWADTERVRYFLEREERHRAENGSGDEGEGDAERGYICTVFVGERKVVRVDGGVSKEEVKTKAAEKAIAILKAEKETREDKGYMKMDLHGEGKGQELGVEDGDVMEL